MLDNRIYKNVHIRIQTFAYESGQLGFDTDEASHVFTDEVTNIFSALGFEIVPARFSSACPDVVRGMEKLYCHPQDLSGYLAEESISEIEAALVNAKTFKHRFTDTYETVYNYTEDEFSEALESQRENIKTAILERFKTKRRNLYISHYALDDVQSGLKFFDRNIHAVKPLEKMNREFIVAVFDELVESQQIVFAEKNGTKYYRSRSHRDPKIAV